MRERNAYGRPDRFPRPLWADRKTTQPNEPCVDTGGIHGRETLGCVWSDRLRLRRILQDLHLLGRPNSRCIRPHPFQVDARVVQIR